MKPKDADQTAFSVPKALIYINTTNENPAIENKLLDRLKQIPQPTEHITGLI